MNARGAAARVVRWAVAGLSRTAHPRLEGRLSVAGLWDDVEVLRDGWGVPHIYARNSRDLFVAQGYVHAQERLWQMDYCRRLAAGRLAEVLGEEALAVDRWTRTLRLRPSAEADAAALRGEARDVLAAYARGVSAYIASGPLPVEFRLLAYRPEPWTAADSLSWQKVISWFLSVNWESELLRASLIERLGADLAAELEPAALDSWPTIVPPEEDVAGLARRDVRPPHKASAAGSGVGGALRRAADARTLLGPTALDGLGSNCWAVHGSRTASGAPLLANDMHLALNTPAIWFENHLERGGWRVTGVSFPGVPGVVAGHNGEVAWGLTNGFADVQDLYVERLRGDPGDGDVQAEYEGRWHNALVERHVIRVRGRRSVRHQAVVTRHGPIISDLAPGLAEEAVALRWPAYAPDTTFEALLRLDRAHAVADVHRALAQWCSPAQNVTYADVRGDIAYTLAGRLPRRRAGDGSVPVPGWTAEYEWDGYVRYEEMPHMVNPGSGAIVTANNRIVDDRYPHTLGRDSYPGNRAERIVGLLQGATQVNVAHARTMQYDQVSTAARRMAEHVVEAAGADEELQRLVSPLRGWEGDLQLDSRAAAIYEVFVRCALANLVERAVAPDGLDADLAARYQGKGPNPLLAPKSMMGERALQWLETALAAPGSRWFSRQPGASRDDLVRHALREAREFLTHTLGPDPQAWTWGRLHKVTFRHPLGVVPLLAEALNRGPYAVGGDAHTICASGSARAGLQGGDIIGPPYRMIVDLGDLAASVAQMVPGQSGRPGDPHYDDGIGPWLAGEYHPMLFERCAVVGATRQRLDLLPRRTRGGATTGVGDARSDHL